MTRNPEAFHDPISGQVRRPGATVGHAPWPFRIAMLLIPPRCHRSIRHVVVAIYQPMVVHEALHVPAVLSENMQRLLCKSEQNLPAQPCDNPMGPLKSSMQLSQFSTTVLWWVPISHIFPICNIRDLLICKAIESLTEIPS